MKSLKEFFSKKKENKQMREEWSRYTDSIPLYIGSHTYPILQEPSHVLITGCSGAGKTASGVYHEIHRTVKHGNNICCFGREGATDNHSEFYKIIPWLLSQGYQVHELNLETDIFPVINSFEKVAIFFWNKAAWTEEDMSNIIELQHKTMEVIYGQFCSLKDSDQKLTIIVDDLDFYGISEAFEEIFRKSRSQGIRFVFTGSSYYSLQDSIELSQFHSILYNVNHVLMNDFAITDTPILERIFAKVPPKDYEADKQIAYCNCREKDSLKTIAFIYPESLYTFKEQ